MGPGKSDKAAHEFDKVDICESYSERDLDLYLNCPVRYRYTVVERLQGEWDGSTYLQFHRCVYITIAWLEEERQKGNAVGSSEALSQLSSLWASGGPGEYRTDRSFAVHERQSIEVAAGDKLLMLANRKDEGFRATNGELTTVRGVDRDGIHLDDGRSIPANCREFTHGYAVTAHRSQGKTVDSVIISADVMKQELFYVLASRGREDITILTSDVNRLGESLGVSTARPSAIELANEIAHSKQAVDLAPKVSIEVPSPQLEIRLGHGFELSM